MGPECGPDLHAALVRDRAADSRGEPRRTDGREPRADRTGGDVRPSRPPRVDMDSSESQVHGQQEASAYNLGNLWRRLGLPARIDTWSLTSLQQRLVKTGGRLVRHARYYWLLLAESHLTRRLFESMLQRIWALPLPTG